MFGGWHVLIAGVAGTMLAVAPARASSPERWAEARSAHFVVLSDSGEKDAVRLASYFERMRLVLQTLLPAADDEGSLPMRVVAVRDTRAMRALEPATYLGSGQVELAGFFLHSVDEDSIVVRGDAEQAHAYGTVYHEYTHSLLRKVSGWMPLWLNEGLAQFYENTDFGQKAVWLGGANAEQMKLLQEGEMLPMATLLTVDAGSPYYHDEAKGSMFYAESWALTHMLIVSDRTKGSHRMREYMERLALGEDSVTAATAVFGDLSKLQAALGAYVMQKRMMYFAVPAEGEVDARSIAVRPVTDREADAVRADVMAHTDRTEEAEALAKRVLGTEKQALAEETMGLLRYRAGDMQAAGRWFAEALALDPESYRARCYYAAALAHAKGSSVEIEANLREAMRLNPAYAPAYDALAMYGARRHLDGREAQTLAMRAVELEPGELSFRLDCAEVLAENRKYAESLSVLRQAMPLAKTAEQTAAVRDRIGRVEGYQSAAGSKRVLVDEGEDGRGSGQ